MSKKIDENMLLQEALNQGLVIYKDDIQLLIDKELEKAKEIFKKEAILDAKKDSQRKAEKIETSQVIDKMKGTGLTNKEFARRLMKMNMPVSLWKYLRDEHHKFKEDIKLWNLAREAVNNSGKR